MPPDRAPSTATFPLTHFTAARVLPAGPGADSPNGVAWTNRGSSAELPLAGVVELLTTPRAAKGKFSCPYFVGARLDGGVRELARHRGARLVVWDVDDGRTTREAHAALIDVFHLIYTSWSHRPDAPRFRVVVALTEEVDLHGYGAVWRWGNDRLGGSADMQARAPVQPMFLPAIRPDGRRAGAGVWASAPLLDPAPIVEAAPPPLPVRLRPTGPVRAIVVPPSSARSAARARLNADPSVRLAAATRLGAVVTENRATHIQCPRCGDRSVWFFIQPTIRKIAACNHRNTCGWYGFLDDLIDATAGGPHV